MTEPCECCHGLRVVWAEWHLGEMYEEPCPACTDVEPVDEVEASDD